MNVYIEVKRAHFPVNRKTGLSLQASAFDTLRYSGTDAFRSIPCALRMNEL